MRKIYCRFCGKQIDEDSTFCAHCGRELTNGNPHVKENANFWESISQKFKSIIFIPICLVQRYKQQFKNDEKSKLLRKRIKRIVLVLFSAIIFLLLLAVGAWGYDYYKYDYLPQIALDYACNDILAKFRSSDKAISLEYSRKILLNEWAFYDDLETWGYDKVPNRYITERMHSYRNEAFKKIESEAYNGDPRIQYLLGHIYIGKYVNQYRGVGNSIIYEREYSIQPDTIKAVYWWNEALKQGFVPAFNSMGIAYKLGWGVDKDMKKSIEYLKKGAESGDAKAQCNYGDLLRDGVKINTGSHVVKEPQYIYGHYYGTENVTIQDSLIILPQDIAQAKYWWGKAAAQGNQIAKERLQKIY